jgi:hypothetical protein
VSKNASIPTDPKVVKALKLIESGGASITIRGACKTTGANRSTVRHHLRARGWVGKDSPRAKKEMVQQTKAIVVETSAIQYHLIASADGQKSLTVFIPGESPVIVAGDHPKFDDILIEAGQSKPNVTRLRELADTTIIVSTRFEGLTDRITTRNGKLYFDGDELDNALTQKILEMLDEGNEDWQAFVNFMDKLYLNPNPNARDAFYGWLSSRPFGITPEGDIVGYKGVRSALLLSVDFEFQSCTNGPAIVNGEPYEKSDGFGVPQSIGDVVEKPRSSVDTSTSHECSDGLHVGTYSYASAYGNTVLKVIVNPRDVVGVPTGALNSEKFRCCRYVIDGIGKDTKAVATNERS